MLVGVVLCVCVSHSCVSAHRAHWLTPDGQMEEDGVGSTHVLSAGAQLNWGADGVCVCVLCVFLLVGVVLCVCLNWGAGGVCVCVLSVFLLVGVVLCVCVSHSCASAHRAHLLTPDR